MDSEIFVGSKIYKGEVNIVFVGGSRDGIEGLMDVSMIRPELWFPCRNNPRANDMGNDGKPRISHTEEEPKDSELYKLLARDDGSLYFEIVRRSK